MFNAGYGILDVLAGIGAVLVVWAVMRPGRRRRRK